MTPDQRALAARDYFERSLNEGTRQTLGWLLDEVDETAPGYMAVEQAIRTLVQDRTERYLFSRSEADKVLDMLDSVVAYRAEGGLSDTFGLTDLMRMRIEKQAKGF